LGAYLVIKRKKNRRKDKKDLTNFKTVLYLNYRKDYRRDDHNKLTFINIENSILKDRERNV